jgi:hypothetical protein
MTWSVLLWTVAAGMLILAVPLAAAAASSRRRPR